MLNKATQKQLRQFVEQIERLEEEKASIAADIRDKYAEAKALGFDVKAMRQIVKMRKKSKEQREEEQAVLDTYAHALGMLGELADTPLGTAYLAKKYGEPVEPEDVPPKPETPAVSEAEAMEADNPTSFEKMDREAIARGDPETARLRHSRTLPKARKLTKKQIDAEKRKHAKRVADKYFPADDPGHLPSVGEMMAAGRS